MRHWSPRSGRSGFHSSQVKVPPLARIWADPGTEASVRVCTTASGRPAAASPRRSSRPWLGPTSMPEARHVGADRGALGRRHDAVGERQGVRLLRRLPARRSVGVDPVHVQTIGAARSTPFTAAVSWAARAWLLCAPALSPAMVASSATRLNALTVSTLLAVSAATERS